MSLSMNPSNPTPVNIALVGLNFGRWIVEALTSHPEWGFNISAVCDMNAQKAADFGRRLGVPAYTSLDQVLADDGVRAVGLYTGPVGRAKLLRQIIRSGRDVMTTKPFETDPAEARSVLEEAKSSGRTIYQNSPSAVPAADLQQILDWQREFNLGRPVSARTDVVVRYHEQADGSWYDDPRLCPAAPIFRLGIYTINDLARLFGGVESVQVQATRLLTGRPTPDNAQLGLVFKNGALGSVYATFAVDDGQYYANSFILHYERGTIYRNITPVTYGTANRGTRLQIVAKTSERECVIREQIIPPGADHEDYPFAELHRAIVSGPAAAAPMPIDDVVHGIQVIEAMNRAQFSGKSEQVG